MLQAVDDSRVKDFLISTVNEIKCYTGFFKEKKKG